MQRLLPLAAGDAEPDEEFWVSDPGYQHVRGVMVASADGAAQAQGRAKGLSGHADEALFAVLRSHADVLLVGAGTARAEHYGGERPTAERVRWRAARGLSQAPPIAVVTASCELDPEGPLFTDTLVRPIVITSTAAPPARVAALGERAEVIIAGTADVDLAVALDALAERGLRRVSCEGGPRLLAQVVAAGRLDELTLSLSPLLIGGEADASSTDRCSRVVSSSS
jgi:riboflavin biosynthesis pyrimidine reductase